MHMHQVRPVVIADQLPEQLTTLQQDKIARE